MNIKPDDKLAYIVAPYVPSGRGHFVTIERKAQGREVLNGQAFSDRPYPGTGWVCSGAVPDDKGGIQTLLVIGDVCLRPIRNQPGNEDFVVESRRSLPRKKPVTGPVTIDNRGEVAR